MSVYRVLRASLYRRSGILTVFVEDSGGNHGGRGADLDVEGMNGRTVRLRGGRVVWDEQNNLTSKRILIIEPPDFPVDELKGRRLLSGP